MGCPLAVPTLTEVMPEPLQYCIEYHVIVIIGSHYKGTQLYTGLLWLLQINGLVQDCSISTANALEILQSCTKPLR